MTATKYCSWDDALASRCPSSGGYGTSIGELGPSIGLAAWLGPSSGLASVEPGDVSFARTRRGWH